MISITKEELKQTLKDKLKECDKDTLVNIIADVCLMYIRGLAINATNLNIY